MMDKVQNSFMYYHHQKPSNFFFLTNMTPFFKPMQVHTQTVFSVTNFL